MTTFHGNCDMSTNQKKMSNGLMHCNVSVAAFSQSSQLTLGKSYLIQVVSTNVNDISCKKGEETTTLREVLQVTVGPTFQLICVNIGNHNKTSAAICLPHHFISCINFRTSILLSRCHLMSIVFSPTLPYCSVTNRKK